MIDTHWRINFAGGYTDSKRWIEEIEDDDEELVAPTTRDVENSMEILKNLSLFIEKKRSPNARSC